MSRSSVGTTPKPQIPHLIQGQEGELALLVIWMRTITPVIAPAMCKSAIQLYARIRGLEKKYGRELLDHVDRLFKGFKCPIHGTVEPCLDGSTLKSVINNYLRLFGRKYITYGIFFSEDSCSCETRIITTTKKVKRGNKEETVLVKNPLTYEFIAPEQELHGVLATNDREVINKLSTLVNKVVIIGGRVSRGFGRVLVERVEAVQI